MNHNRLISKNARIIAFAAVWAAGVGLSAASASVWNNTSSGLWSDATKWDSGVPNAIDAVADFSQSDLTSNRTIQIDGTDTTNYTIGTLLIGDVDGTNRWTIQSQAGTSNGLIFEVSSGNASLLVPSTAGEDVIKAPFQLNSSLDVVNSSDSNFFWLNNAISGDGGITVNGLVKLGSNTKNTYTGGFTLQTGTVLLTGSQGSRQQFGTGLVTLNGGTVASSNANNYTYDNNVNINGDVTLGQSGSGMLTFNGTTTLLGASRVLTISAPVTFGGPVGDGGNALGLIKTGADTLTLSGANTFTGNTVIVDGTLELAAGASLLIDVNNPDQLSTHILGTAGGSETAILDGTLLFDVSGFTDTDNASWNIVDFINMTPTLGSNFNVDLVGQSNAFSRNGDVWTTGTIDSKIWTFNGTTGVLSVAFVPEPVMGLLFSVAAPLMLLRRNRA